MSKSVFLKSFKKNIIFIMPFTIASLMLPALIIFFSTINGEKDSFLFEILNSLYFFPSETSIPAFTCLGFLLPLIGFAIIVSNAISGKVKNGEMQQLLTTPTGRKKIVNSEIASILLVFIVHIMISFGVLYAALKSKNVAIDWDTLLIAIFDFVLLLSLYVAISFFISVILDSKALGVTLGIVLFLVSSILPVLSEISSLHAPFLKYVTLNQLFSFDEIFVYGSEDNVKVILSTKIVWIIKMIISLVLSTTFFFSGKTVFEKKDLNF